MSTPLPPSRSPVTDFFPYGVQYHRAPTPLPAEWDGDLARIASIGYTHVQFRPQWRWHERIRGRYAFDDLDRLFDLAGKHRLRVVLKPMLETAPDWLPDDVEQWPRLVCQRFETIASRYAERIDTWDVVNEVFRRTPCTPAPRNYVTWCYEQADELFPNSRLFVNETGQHAFGAFGYEDSPYHILIERPQAAGCRVDGIGMQHHQFGVQQTHASALTTGPHSPTWEAEVIDHYAQFKLPIHISEITIGSAGGHENAEAIQARIVRDYYRLWFSCPSVEAIVWWNLADGDAYGTEAETKGGLIREDHSLKPAYEALDQLINHDWKTTATLTTDSAGRATFRGFHGTYDVRVGGTTQAAEVTGERCEITVTV